MVHCLIGIFHFFIVRRVKKTEVFVRDAVEARLRMIIPYIYNWPQVGVHLSPKGMTSNMDWLDSEGTRKYHITRMGTLPFSLVSALDAGQI